LTIEGVECSRDFHLRVMEDPEFRAGDIEIQWLERRLDSLLAVQPPAETARTAAVVAALIADRDRQAPKRASVGPGNVASVQQIDAWTRAGRLDGLR
jgi:acetyl-CoA carboxylase biotin carboxylase subunit